MPASWDGLKNLTSRQSHAAVRHVPVVLKQPVALAQGIVN